MYGLQGGFDPLWAMFMILYIILHYNVPLWSMEIISQKVSHLTPIGTGSQNQTCNLHLKVGMPKWQFHGEQYDYNMIHRGFVDYWLVRSYQLLVESIFVMSWKLQHGLRSVLGTYRLSRASRLPPEIVSRCWYLATTREPVMWQVPGSGTSMMYKGAIFGGKGRLKLDRI